MELLKLISSRAEPEKPGTLFSIVKIDCAFTNNQMLPSGHLLTQGVHFVRVPSADVPKIMANVEPHPEWLEQAEASYNAQLEEEVQRARDAVEPIYKDQAEAAARQRFPGSVSGEFARQHRRDLKPFRSVEVIEQNLLAEQDEQKMQLEEQQVRRMAAALGGGASLSRDDIQKLINAEAQKLIADAVAKALEAERAKQAQAQKR